MNRLTKKVSKTVQDKYSLGTYLYYDFANADDTNKLLNKLGEFEDFIEEEGFEDLQDLKRYIEQSIKVSELITKKKQENQELKDHTYDLNNKLLNLQLFLKKLREDFHKGDETYEEIDKKLKELGGGDERNTN